MTAENILSLHARACESVDRRLESDRGILTQLCCSLNCIACLYPT